MAGLTNNLVALMLDDDGYRQGFYPALMSRADISASVVPDSDAALREFDRINFSKQPLDVCRTRAT